MAKPGVLFYFDIRPCIKRLSIADKGRLFEAILDYGEFGTVPNFSGVLAIAWDFIQPKLDNDTARYNKQVLQKKYAAYSREVKKGGGTPMDFDEWKVSANIDDDQPISADVGRYPTTTSISTTTSTSTTTTTSTVNREADKPPTHTKKVFSAYGWVKLTQGEYENLVNDLGEQEVKRCIDLVDERAQTTANKNKWKDWNLVIRRCSREGWGNAQSGTPVKTMPNYGGIDNCSL